MSSPPDLSFVQENIDRIPGFTLDLGKGVTEFDYIEGVALAPVVANWRTRFLLKKPSGKEANIQMSGEILLREGHFVAAVWALNRKEDVEYIVGLVNHTMGTTHVLDSIQSLPKTTLPLKLVAFAIFLLVVFVFYNFILTSLNAPVMNLIFSILAGGAFGLVPISLVNENILKPIAARKIEKKVKGYLSEILRSRSS